VLALYGLLFLLEIGNQGIVPLAPRFAEQFDLSKVETGAILATASALSVLVCVPVGLWTDRLGPRVPTLTAAALTVLGCAGIAFADDFWTLLAARAVFGAGFATAWTAGLVWLAQLVPQGRRTHALGATVTTAGVAGLVGPTLTGQLAERFGVAVPFTALAIGSVVVLGCLVPLASTRPAGRVRQSLRETFGSARRSRAVAGGFALTVLGGLVGSVVNLLVPLQLDANGLSEGTIGVVFSAGAGLFIVVSGTVARLGERATRIRVGGTASLLLGGVLVLVVASTATPVLVTFIALRAPLFAILFTLSFPLAASGARRAGVGEGAVLGLLNVLWGIATVIGPLAGGALAEGAGQRAAYGAAIACCLVTAGWALVAGRAKAAAPDTAPLASS
jgi:predicted MFS family arabinose efflux permease